MQQSLFESGKPGVNVPKISKQKKVLSKNQQAFNRLSSRISKLRQEIETNLTKLTKLNGIYAKEIIPVIEELGRQKINLATRLANKYTTINLSNKQKDEVEMIIFDLLDDAFAVITPTEEEIKLYNRFSELSFEETIEEEKQEMKEDLEEKLFDLFGIDMNLDEMDDSPEGYANLQQKMKEKISEQQEKNQQKKKTKKQIEQEARFLKEEEVKKRSLRSIYMSLAKLLHPDTEMDETVKMEKEHIMKDVTKAYNEKDLATLLKLELQWVAKENDHLDQLSDDKLKIYISVLKEQVQQLEMERAMQLSNPAFGAVARFVEVDEVVALNSIKKEKKDRSLIIEHIKEHTSALAGSKVRAAIKDCIDAFMPAMVDDDMPSFDELMEIMMKHRKF